MEMSYADYIIISNRRFARFLNLQSLHKPCYIQKNIIDRAASRNEEFDISQIFK